MGAVPAITRVRGGKIRLGQVILATGQNLDKACINQEGGSQHNGDDECIHSDVPVKVPQGRPEGEDKQKLGPRPTVAKSDRPHAAGEKLTNKLLMAMLVVHSANTQRQT